MDPHPSTLPSTDPGTHSSKRLLVIDDDRDYADSVCELLRLTCAWEVEAAYSPQQALSQAQAHPPDAVLLDMEMPEMDGFETADRLLDAEAAHPPCLIAVTGNAALCDEASHDSRFADALLKPPDPSRLLALLEERAGDAEPERPRR